MSWALVLDPPSSDATRLVAGLPLALRLGLDAQAGGASAVVVSDPRGATAASLQDVRLRIPVLRELPATTRAVRVPASYVVHRQLFKAIAQFDAASKDPPAERDLAREPFEHEVPWGFNPMDVRDKASAKAAERALFRALRKPEDGWTSRFLNRYLSLAVSRVLVHTRLAPNQISVAILGVGLLGAWFAASGTEGGLIAGAALFQTQSVLDGCDGELSRVTHRGSRTGEWLDTIGDDLTNYGFFAGAALGLYRLEGSVPYLVAGVITVVAGFIASGFEYRYLIRIGSGDLLKYPLSRREGSGGFARIAPLFKRDTFVLLTLIAAAIGLLGPMLVLFSLAAIGILVGVLKTELELKRQGLP